jgi:hypothetical protein
VINGASRTFSNYSLLDRKGPKYHAEVRVDILMKAKSDQSIEFSRIKF